MDEFYGLRRVGGIRVQAGDCYVVPAGTPHAIGWSPEGVIIDGAFRPEVERNVSLITYNSLNQMTSQIDTAVDAFGGRG